MLDNAERQRRKLVLSELKAAERAKAEAMLPASRQQLKALIDWVDGHLEDGYDHSLRYTVEYIRTNDLDEPGTLEWLRKHGGYCDCEVVMNVEDSCPAFK
ncbi:DUF2695 domain-containing protein [uncultured Paludibaculum sp.]|uniref:DUF2695 domain-containing protein n=1 Tax=uncultured Paludibaculum sp. TaxID=1765020 RepID=UPI002AAAB1B6|nr:DUF2695 domain-containing protein [uncultured Paludibaculum sp.]